MMDEKTYKKEIVRMWDSIRDDEYKGMDVCSGVYCNKKCALYGVNEISKPICCDVVDAFQQIKAIEKWSKEHPEKHKISQLEYDILKTYSDDHFYYFYESEFLKLLLKKGYFQGANEKMNIEHYFNNCEVKEDV